MTAARIPTETAYPTTRTSARRILDYPSCSAARTLAREIGMTMASPTMWTPAPTRRGFQRMMAAHHPEREVTKTAMASPTTRNLWKGPLMT